jgi:hypothetical protein
MKRLSRRTVLRGAGGIALGLPLLEAMQGRPASAQSAASPRRIIFVFQANGDQVSQRFTATGETTFQFGEFLAPLEPYRNEILILNRLSKLFGKLPATGRADNHEQGGSSLAPFASGAGSYPIGGSTQTVGYVLGPSADYAIGDRVLAQNPNLAHRHLVYRVGGKQNNIWNLHSHAGPVGTQNPVPPETDPYAAYARIFSFGGTDAAARAEILKRLAQKQSALDLVLDEANGLRGRLGSQDREKLDLHTQSLRDIERTLMTGSGAPVCVPVDLGTVIDPYADANHAVVGGLFFKIMTMALACDMSRSIQFNWSGNTSNRIYKNLALTEGHHDISHNSTDDAFAKIRSIHKHLWTQNTALYQALKAVPEGDGTLWDHTLIVHWNELAQGDSHAVNDSMVILAGGAHGYFRRGRYLDFANQSSFSDMLVNCFQYMGFDDVTSFGDPVLKQKGSLSGLS